MRQKVRPGTCHKRTHSTCPPTKETGSRLGEYGADTAGRWELSAYGAREWEPGNDVNNVYCRLGKAEVSHPKPSETPPLQST